MVLGVVDPQFIEGKEDEAQVLWLSHLCFGAGRIHTVSLSRSSGDTRTPVMQ